MVATADEIPAVLWLLAVGGGTLLLALGFAYGLLLQRRRAAQRVEISSEALSPSREARGRALRAPDIISCVAGLWLFLSPFVVGGFGPALTASNAVFGALIAIFSLAAIFRVHPLEELINAVVAAWVFAAPWAIGPANVSAAVKWSNGPAAGVVVVCSVIGLIELSHRSNPVATHR
jgi:hypothetical protein